MAAVEDAGFEVKVTSQGGMEMVRLTVTGMTCGNCAGNVERALRQVAGVSEASVSYVTSLAEVMYNSSDTGALPGLPVDALQMAAGPCLARSSLLTAPVARSRLGAL